jgi:DNA-binding response OmpR family regulator
VIALGNLAGELKTSLEAAARAVGVELLLTREPARAFVELERDGALAVLVDMATLGAEQFCKRARGTERLRSVPVIGMSRHPNELGFARVFAWGADDLVPLGARIPLERRLLVLRDTPAADATGFGQAVVAEATTQRRALVGRVLSQAGYDVKFAVDRGAVELYASQSETRLVVISAALGDPRRIIEAAAKAGALPTWIVTVESRSSQRLAAALAGLDRVAVTSTAGSPEDVLFLANELVFSKGARRREWRALYATPVAFRPAGGDSDEYGFSYDASPSGLYVRSLLPCATEDVEVELRLPNRDERVRLSGKVAKRFAFGSGAIASAPPGFSVKLEGPEPELARWTEACAALIAQASSESLPPRARVPSQPVLQSPGPGAKEVTLAVPPATVSIESVVAPLPVSVQAAVAEGSDVGELLAATLDEQTLTEVGTRPVTMDSSGGVREQRPSEFGVSLQGLDPLATPIINDPLRAVPSGPAPSKTPTPVPVAATPAEPPRPIPPPGRLPRPIPGRTLSGTLVVDPVTEAAPAEVASAEAAPAEPAPPETAPPESPPPRSADWDADAKTEVRGSQPSIEPPAAPITLVPDPDPEDEAEPVPPPAPGREPTSTAKAFAATVVAPPPPPSRSFAKLAAVSPPAAPTADAAPAPAANGAPPVPAANPRTALQAPSIKQTLPMGFSKQEAPPVTANPTPSPRSTGSTASPTAPARPTPPTSPAARQAFTAQRAVLYALASLAALGVGAGAAFVMHSQQAPSRSAPEQDAAATATEPTLSPSSAAVPPAAVSAAPEPTTAPPSEPRTGASTVDAPSTAASVTATAPVAPSAAPVAASEPAPESAAPPPPATASTAPAPAAAPLPVSGPPIDLTKLAADRAALIVHSSVSTHVFVHGTDYGETNRPLVTSCGIRFVRLGRALGDFIEPGQSRVIKCGRLTELTIEPAP